MNMKKALTILLTVLSVLLLDSCMGEPGRDGRDGRDGLGVIKSVQINVPEEAWQYSGIDTENYYFATVDMPEINDEVLKKGLVKMYMYFGNSQVEMPFTKYREEYIEEDNSWVFYTQMVDYEFSKGQIIIFYTISDFIYEESANVYDFSPGDMKFRCVVMY